ncbi:adhesin [Streptomyces sp. NPDC004647]|uniref:adhesin n=1 Tax=Streptomyces sp. NPDC004647 TaxID=3154671 RepID=UPI0033B356DB
MVTPESSAGKTQTPEPWIIKETLYGRWTTLSRARQAGIAAGAVLALSGLGVLLASSLFSGSDTRSDEAADIEPRDAPKPSLILPTGVPAEPTPTPTSSSPSSSHSSKPSRRTHAPDPKPTKKPSAPAEPVTYTAWAGHGCHSSEHGNYGEVNHYENGIEGWYIVDSGGYDGGSCSGTFGAVPMSGSRSEDGGNVVLWWWSVGRDSDKCALSVYVPSSDNSRDVAGNPTMYQVFSHPDDWDAVYSAFQIDQTANRGRLVDVGTYRVQDGYIGVKMLDRGEDWEDEGPTYAHHAASQMKVTCRGT